MTDTTKGDASNHVPSKVRDAQWWATKFGENIVLVALAAVSAGTVVYQFEEVRYKDITEVLKGQIGTQTATIANQNATIVQLREQLKGTSPELAAIQANRDRIRAGLQSFYVRGGELFRRTVSDEPSMNQWVTDANAWSSETQIWIVENMGEAAGERFVDQGNTGSIDWSSSFNQEHSHMRNGIARRRQNLSELIETAAWDGRPNKGKQGGVP